MMELRPKGLLQILGNHVFVRASHSADCFLLNNPARICPSQSWFSISVIYNREYYFSVYNFDPCYCACIHGI
ncbi:hypothetical protein K1719_012088 [Acacia pycnantha]|nr:hypothetical protein K1719_012088 [Acacia pycnantha]